MTKFAEEPQVSPRTSSVDLDELRHSSRDHNHPSEHHHHQDHDHHKPEVEEARALAQAVRRARDERHTEPERTPMSRQRLEDLRRISVCSSALPSTMEHVNELAADEAYTPQTKGRVCPRIEALRRKSEEVRRMMEEQNEQREHSTEPSEEEVHELAEKTEELLDEVKELEEDLEYCHEHDCEKKTPLVSITEKGEKAFSDELVRGIRRQADIITKYYNESSAKTLSESLVDYVEQVAEEQRQEDERTRTKVRKLEELKHQMVMRRPRGSITREDAARIAAIERQIEDLRHRLNS